MFITVSVSFSAKITILAEKKQVCFPVSQYLNYSMHICELFFHFALLKRHAATSMLTKPGVLLHTNRMRVQCLIHLFPGCDTQWHQNDLPATSNIHNF